jgi:hypothetical protein
VAIKHVIVLFVETPRKFITAKLSIRKGRNFLKISLLKVENFQLQNFFSDGKFVSANQIAQNFLSAENFPSGYGP